MPYRTVNAPNASDSTQSAMSCETVTHAQTHRERRLLSTARAGSRETVKKQYRSSGDGERGLAGGGHLCCCRARSRTTGWRLVLADRETSTKEEEEAEGATAGSHEGPLASVFTFIYMRRGMVWAGCSRAGGVFGPQRRGHRGNLPAFRVMRGVLPLARRARWRSVGAPSGYVTARGDLQCCTADLLTCSTVLDPPNG